MAVKGGFPMFGGDLELGGTMELRIGGGKSITCRLVHVDHLIDQGQLEYRFEEVPSCDKSFANCQNPTRFGGFPGGPYGANVCSHIFKDTRCGVGCCPLCENDVDKCECDKEVNEPDPNGCYQSPMYDKIGNCEECNQVLCSGDGYESYSDNYLVCKPCVHGNKPVVAERKPFASGGIVSPKTVMKEVAKTLVQKIVEQAVKDSWKVERQNVLCADRQQDWCLYVPPVDEMEEARRIKVEWPEDEAERHYLMDEMLTLQFDQWDMLKEYRQQLNTFTDDNPIPMSLVYKMHGIKPWKKPEPQCLKETCPHPGNGHSKDCAWAQWKGIV